MPQPEWLEHSKHVVCDEAQPGLGRLCEPWVIWGFIWRVRVQKILCRKDTTTFMVFEIFIYFLIPSLGFGFGPGTCCTLTLTRIFLFSEFLEESCWVRG